MKSKVYDMMNWREIEGVLYSDIDYPYNILGPKETKKGLLIQTFKPEALSVSVIDDKTGKEYKMEQMDEEGYFAVLIPKVKQSIYNFMVERYPEHEEHYRKYLL